MLPESKAALSALGERFREYKESPSDRAVLQEYREYRCGAMGELFGRLAAVIDGSPAVLSCRVKRVDTIIRKLRRQQEMALPRMDDILGFRIVTASYAVQKLLVERVRERVDVKRVRDYTVQPAPTGYRAVHLALSQSLTLPSSNVVQSYTSELQIRTYFQNLWGTVSESFGEQVKEGGGTEDERLYLLELSQLIRNFSENNPDKAQVEGLAATGGNVFFVVHYDKTKNETIRTDSFGDDVEGALRQITYLEDLHRQDLARETVLLGAPKIKELGVTHLRYFQAGGTPELPEFLIPRRPRPQVIVN